MAWYNSMNDLKSGMAGVGAQIFGDRDDTGIIGSGQFKGNEIPIDDAAFRDTSRYDKVNADLAAAIARMQGGGGVQASRGLPGFAGNIPAIGGGQPGSGMNAAPQNQFRGMQMDLARALQAQAAGGGPPSIAQQMLANQTNQNIMTAQAQAASMRGINPAMALRLSQNQAASLNQQAANQGSLLRSQEILGAQNALGGLTTNARGQDIDFARALEASQTARDQNILQALAQQAQLANAATMGARDLEKLRVNQRLGMSGVNASAYGDAAKRRADMMGALGESFTGGGMAKILGGGGGGGGFMGSIASAAVM